LKASDVVLALAMAKHYMPISEYVKRLFPLSPQGKRLQPVANREAATALPDGGFRRLSQSLAPHRNCPQGNPLPFTKAHHCFAAILTLHA
jgi:hypothetical protein